GPGGPERPMSADTEQHSEPMTAASRPQSRRPDLRRPETRGSARGAAARAAFPSGGCAEANVTDIVAAAGASVGSLYHHFSGKSDLFLTLFEEFHTRLTERTGAEVHQLRDQGGRGPSQLFLDGARA